MSKGGSVYRILLRDAWQISWRNRFLWLLGFLAIFWGIESLSAFERIFGLFAVRPDLSPSPASAIFPVIRGATPGGVAVAILFSLFLLALITAFIWLTTVSRGALIEAITRRLDGKPAQVADSLRRVAKYFWPLLGIAVLSRLDLLLYLFVLPPLAELRESGSAAALPLFVLAFVATTLISLTLTMLGIYASAYVVIHGERFTDAIVQSLRLFARFWLVSIELALLLYLITLAAGVAFVVVFAVLGIPLLLLAAIGSLLQVTGVSAAVSVLALLIFLALLLVGAAVLITFQFSCWTLLFLRLTEQGAVAKALRATARFAHIFHRKIV